MERSLAGEGWIQEAVLVAETEPARLRAHLELAARFAADEHFEGARRMLADAGEHCTSAASAQVITQWDSDLDELRVAFTKRHEQHESAAQDAYVGRLRERRQAAIDRGDSQASSRYDQLLTDAGATE